MERSELLTPSLGKQALRPYSIQAMFWTSFLGGIFAVVAFSVLNMRRLETLKRDWWLPLLGVVLSVAFVLLSFQIDRRFVRYTGIALAFCYLSIFYWRNREVLTLESMLERKPAPAIKVAILCILFGLGIAVAISFLVTQYG